MRRHALGIIGLVFLITFVIMLVTGNATSARSAFFASICMRVGLILGMSWLAYPQLERIARRLPRWAWALVAIGLLVLVAVPKMFPVAFAVFAAIAIVQFIGWLFKPPSSKDKPKSH